MSATLNGFSINHERQGTTVWIRVTGELDLATTPRLREACAREQADGAGVIILDLAGVTFIDSTGLHAVIDAHESDSDQRLRIVLSAPVARVIDIVNLRGGLPIIEG